MHKRLPAAAALLLCGFFVAAGLLLLPYPGAQYDELLFLNGVLRPEVAEGWIRLPWAGRVPTMLMSYLGTLKALLYAPVFRIWGLSDWTLRLPVLLLGAVSVWLFFLLARRLAGPGAALAATALLATDACYLLTSVFDWGPVVLQHLCLTSGLYALTRFAEGGERRWLFAGGLAAGLGLWDKALFLWVLGGFGVGLLVLFPKQIRQIAGSRRLAAAALAGFALGAAPFLHYNLTTGFRTFRGTALRDELRAVLGKAVVLDRTLDGSGLFGYLVRESPEGPPADLREEEKIPLRIAERLGSPRRSWQALLLVFALAAAPVLSWRSPRRRVALLISAAAVLAWAQMAWTRDAGGSVHHAILLWPLLHLQAALAAAALLASAGRLARAAVAAVFAFCALSNAAVLNTYLAHMIACGPAQVWTDASRTLVQFLEAQPGRAAFAADWGILHEIIFYGRNRIPMIGDADGLVLRAGEDPLAAKRLEEALADRKQLFITWREGLDVFPDTRKKLIAFAEARGYRRASVALIADRHGVAMYEIHEFSR
ncbi:MAG: glycosyltransferase family 39 protein [Bryobacteraceae bacterium]|nr:glycosyltransferase family 39 protein [Bryobacteraceae bacterium]